MTPKHCEYVGFASVEVLAGDIFGERIVVDWF